MGEGFLRIRVLTPQKVPDGDAFYASFACPDHHVTMGEMEPVAFSFNEPIGACPTCLGLGIYLPTQSTLMVVVGAVAGWYYDRRVSRGPQIVLDRIFVHTRTLRP